MVAWGKLTVAFLIAAYLVPKDSAMTESAPDRGGWG